MENHAPAAAEANLLLKLLANFALPVSRTRLWEAWPRSEGRPSQEKLKELLREQVKLGHVRSSSRGYWLLELEQRACARIPEALTAEPRTRAELEKSLRSLLPGWPPAKREEMLKQAVREGRVYQWPPLKRNASLFSLQPPDPQAYLQKPIGELAAKLQRLANQLAAAGIAPEQVYATAHELWQQALLACAAAAPEQQQPADTTEPINDTPDYTQFILAGMQQFNASPLVSLTELRRSLAATVPGKTTFDQTVLQLASQGRVVLHRHDYPGGLSQAERAELVNDEHGNYYIGIALNT